MVLKSKIFNEYINKLVEKSLKRQNIKPQKKSIDLKKLYYKIRLYLSETKNLTKPESLKNAINCSSLRVFYDDRYKCVLCSIDFLMTETTSNFEKVYQALLEDQALLLERLNKRQYMLLVLTNPIKEITDKMLPIKTEKIGKTLISKLPNCPINPEPYKPHKERNH